MCCVALPCCLFDLACFFLPSFSSLIKTCMRVQVFDLLNHKMRLRIMEDARHEVQIVGLKEQPVYDLSDVLSIISAGNICR